MSGQSIVMHEVTRFFQWPTELLSITACFSCPIERIQQNGLSGMMTPTGDPLLSTTVDDARNHFEGPTADVSEAVLASANILRLCQDSKGQPTIHVFASLFSTLALACSKEAVILTNTAFLLSRTAAIGCTQYEGQATILVSSYVPPRSRNDQVVSANNDGSYSESENLPPAALLLPLDGPFDGHVIPSSGLHVDCVLPVICVADQDNIRELVISTVYQRYTWGICLPVVGISLENVIARVVIGWIHEEEATGVSDLPTVHIASSADEEINSRLGIFDLSDPVSAIHDLHMDSPSDWWVRVLKWLEGDDSRGQDIIASSEIPGESLSSFENISDISMRLSNHSSSLGSVVTPPPSHYSASRFAQLEDSLLDEKYGVRKWLWERNTIQVICTKLDEYEITSTAHYQVDEMISYYTHILELNCPDLNCMTNDAIAAIPCISLHRNLLNLLFSQMRDHLAESDNTPVLGNEDFSFFKSRLPVFLSAVSLMRQTLNTPNQVKMRDPFDLLVEFFWCKKEEKISNSYLQNCKIQFASNKATASTLYDNKQAYLCEVITWYQQEAFTPDTPASLKDAVEERQMDIRKKLTKTYLVPELTINAADRCSEPISGVVDGLAVARTMIDYRGSAIEVLLPRLVVKYKETKDRDSKIALRLCQMSCISVVEFLDSVGIAEVPVYGLVVSGSRVSIMMVWHSTKSMVHTDDPALANKAFGFNCIIDENIVTLDIAEPLDAYHFATVMHRIFLAGQHLGDVLKNKDPETIRGLERRFFCRDSE
ncbi:hypothetical protein BDN70DRAFT_991760 [Pholiota conissans]|uniref:Uncharacterized protein n=1 Tax=Pholiota conissans TaxID=109636 RepID=A0A9P5Z7V8_9AGAR|nr:hypothetical protein BDN70DRAFT_991760 [Pholiota conissans]